MVLKVPEIAVRNILSTVGILVCVVSKFVIVVDLVPSRGNKEYPFLTQYLCYKAIKIRMRALLIIIESPACSFFCLGCYS